MRPIPALASRCAVPVRYVTFANRRVLFGHTWDPLAGVQPVLRCAMEFYDPPDVPTCARWVAGGGAVG